MLAVVQAAAETLLLRQRKLVNHQGLVLFLEYGIKRGLVDIEMTARILAGHADAVKTEDDMKRIHKVMRVLGIGKNPARVRIVNLQVGVKSSVIHLHAPILLRETPFIAWR